MCLNKGWSQATLAACLCNRGDAMLNKATVPTCKTNDLVFAHWQQHANEKTYAAKLITKTMYEFARDEIHKKISSFAPDKVAEARYNFE